MGRVAADGVRESAARREPRRGAEGESDSGLRQAKGVCVGKPLSPIRVVIPPVCRFLETISRPP